MCLNNLVFLVRAPVGVFYLNMSKKGKKQDVNDDSIVLPYHHWKMLLEQEDAQRRLRGMCGCKKELRVCWMAMES